jgi:hypothetical protein
MEIQKLLDQVETKSIVLPEFQREYVWSEEQAKQLLVSLLNQYPTGSILLWDTTEPPEIKNEAKHDHGGQYSVILDGQQRITTLYLFIKNDLPPFYTEKDIEHDPRGLRFNLETGNFQYYQKQKMENNPLWQKVIDCFAGKVDIFDVAENMERSSDKEFLKSLNENLNRLKDILKNDYPIQNVPPTAGIDEAIDVFDRINSQGTPLTDAELVLAHISGKWPEVRSTIKNKQQEYKKAGFDFDLDFFTRCIVVTLTGSAVYKSMTYEIYEKFDAQDYEQTWNELSKKLDLLIPIIKDEAYIDGTNDLTTNNVFIPLIAYLVKHGNFVNNYVKHGFLYWMLLAFTWGRYSGQTDQRLDRDVFIAQTSPNPVADLVAELEDQRGRIEVRPADLEGRGAGHPLHRMLYIVSKWKHAPDLFNGGVIKDTFGDYYSIQSHHIFPKNVLYNNGYDSQNHLDKKKVNEIANRAFITRDSNYGISDKRPDEYLKDVANEYLKKHMIPSNKKLWEVENYETFIETRRQTLADAINEFINSYKVDLVEEPTTDPHAMIEAGESNYVEFKQSLRWDYQQNQTTKIPLLSVAKTIAAFMNNEGGTLLIGVGDDQEVAGLDDDYKTFNKDNPRDAFLQRLDNLVGEYIGKELNGLLTTRIEVVDDKDVCIVHVSPSGRPVYVTHEGKEEFYIRANASTQSLSIRESNHYIAEHWKEIG